jgi:cation:H+ antiporter
MLPAILGVVLGLGILTLAADQFVVGSARVATSLRISPIVVGAIVIGFGTSAPELLASGLATARGSLDLAVGNIVGSNVANLTLVLGVAALVAPITVRSPVLRREAPLSLAAVVLFGILVQDGLGWVDGVILTVALAAALLTIMRAAQTEDPRLTAEVEGFLARPDPSPRREWARTLVGLVGTVGAAYLLVESAVTIAAQLGLAQGFVGFTVVAIGTSLPELATGVQAARKGETDLIIGNLLGSNLFNAGAVGAVAAFAGGGQDPGAMMTGRGVTLMIGVAVLATLFMVTSRCVQRWEGALLVVGYLAVLPFLAG